MIAFLCSAGTQPIRDSPDPSAYSYEFVCDVVPHSQGSGDPRVTWRASGVLRRRTGVCYAKAHALAALPRAEDVPAVVCCRRPAHDEGGGCAVHGPVAVRFNGTWHRQDPRGNQPGVGARFSLAGERLASVPDPESNELDYPVLYAEPHPAVPTTLEAAADRSRLWKTLPDAL